MLGRSQRVKKRKNLYTKFALCQNHNALTFRGHYGLVDIVSCYARYGAICVSVNQNYNALTIGASMRRGHYGCLLNLDEWVSFDTSTCEQMLVEAKGRNCGALWFGSLSLDKRASFGMSTWKHMLVEAKGRTARI